MRNNTEEPSNISTKCSQQIVVVPLELLEEAVSVLHDLRRSVCPLEQIRPLSIAEAAKALRCRRQEVEYLIHKGSLPFIKRHGRRYILPDDIHRRLKDETECENPQDRQTRHHLSKNISPKINDIDPHLREFFE